MTTYARQATHTPLPRSRSVVVEVTKIVNIDRPEVVNIDRPEVVIIDHVELVVPVLRGRPTPSQSHSSRS